jgi:Rrf2 family protein
MSSLWRISDATALALHALALLAAPRPGAGSVRAMAAALRVSENHLAKVLQRLARAGLVRGRRGRAGGFALRGRAGEVPVLRIVELFEGKLGTRRCLLATSACTHPCPLAAGLATAERALVEAWGRTRVLDFARNFARGSA